MHILNEFGPHSGHYESCQLSITGSPAALGVLMASAFVVLKHETSTLRQRHIYISINFKFGVGDYVREVTNPDKVDSGPMSCRDATRLKRPLAEKSR